MPWALLSGPTASAPSPQSCPILSPTPLEPLEGEVPLLSLTCGEGAWWAVGSSYCHSSEWSAGVFTGEGGTGLSPCSLAGPVDTGTQRGSLRAGWL